MPKTVRLSNSWRTMLASPLISAWSSLEGSFIASENVDRSQCIVSPGSGLCLVGELLECIGWTGKAQILNGSGPLLILVVVTRSRFP